MATEAKNMVLGTLTKLIIKNIPSIFSLIINFSLFRPAGLENRVLGSNEREDLSGIECKYIKNTSLEMLF